MKRTKHRRKQHTKRVFVYTGLAWELKVANSSGADDINTTLVLTVTISGSENTERLQSSDYFFAQQELFKKKMQSRKVGQIFSNEWECFLPYIRTVTPTWYTKRSRKLRVRVVNAAVRETTVIGWFTILVLLSTAVVGVLLNGRCQTEAQCTITTELM